MFDTIRFMLDERDLDNRVSFVEEVSCRLDRCSNKGNKIVGFLKNMRVEIVGCRMFVEGSLTKWQIGDNYTKVLNLREIRLAIESLGVQLGVSLKGATITRIDVALNLVMEHAASVYLTKLSYLEKYHRSDIEKESLYFTKYNNQLLFYDKSVEVRKVCGTELKHNVLRYEIRFSKVKQYFKREVVGSDLYDVSFCQQLLDEWYQKYMKIEKRQDGLSQMIDFRGKKKFQLSCVAFCCQMLNIRCLLDEAFVKGIIASIDKFGIKEVLDRVEQFEPSADSQSSVIDELTRKIESVYERMKRRLQFSRVNNWFEIG